MYNYTTSHAGHEPGTEGGRVLFSCHSRTNLDARLASSSADFGSCTSMYASVPRGTASTLCDRCEHSRTDKETYG